jgi:hypothetical protein
MSKDKFTPREYVNIVLGYNAHHFVELAMESNENTTEEEMTKAEQMNAVLEAAFLIAAADGKLTDAKIAALSKAAALIFKSSTEEKSPYRETPNGTPNDAMDEEYINASLQSFADLLDEQSYAQRIAYIAEALPNDELRQQAFMLAVDLAMLKGHVPDKESQVINDLAAAFTFDVEKTNSLLEQVETVRKAAQ